jgi:hypothetical protein
VVLKSSIIPLAESVSLIVAPDPRSTPAEPRRRVARPPVAILYSNPDRSRVASLLSLPVTPRVAPAASVQ